MFAHILVSEPDQTCVRLVDGKPVSHWSQQRLESENQLQNQDPHSINGPCRISSTNSNSSRIEEHESVSRQVCRNMILGWCISLPVSEKVMLSDYLLLPTTSCINIEGMTGFWWYIISVVSPCYFEILDGLRGHRTSSATWPQGQRCRLCFGIFLGQDLHGILQEGQVLSWPLRNVPSVGTGHWSHCFLKQVRFALYLTWWRSGKCFAIFRLFVFFCLWHGYVAVRHLIHFSHQWRGATGVGQCQVV